MPDITRNGVCYAIEDSPFYEEVDGYRFYFSSETHRPSSSRRHVSARTGSRIRCRAVSTSTSMPRLPPSSALQPSRVARLLRGIRARRGVPLPRAVEASVVM